jgi:hypothetical protein
MSIILPGFFLFFKIFLKYRVTNCELDNGVQFLTRAGTFLLDILSRLALEDPPNILSNGYNSYLQLVKMPVTLIFLFNARKWHRREFLNYTRVQFHKFLHKSNFTSHKLP